ncbi:hypothetical protein FF38_11377 [Lucilia cuprina]|uniref:MICOS complex subunit MIC10 n=1 Tax=Lucilia cuprina TaxID=7375 RepID=A0A0L0C3A5_LUCCU|nr:hypothetical protein FF38_11377 [Lucilia cuprina]
MSSSPHQTAFMEEEFASLLDRCCVDAFLKSSSGLVIGFLASSLFLKRRKWPTLFGMGFGLGYAYASSSSIERLQVENGIPTKGSVCYLASKKPNMARESAMVIPGIPSFGICRTLLKQMIMRINVWMHYMLTVFLE